jgi:hypothetical protein
VVHLQLERRLAGPVSPVSATASVRFRRRWSVQQA